MGSFQLGPGTKVQGLEIIIRLEKAANVGVCHVDGRFLKTAPAKWLSLGLESVPNGRRPGFLSTKRKQQVVFKL